MEDLHHATGPERMTQLVVPCTGVQYSGGYAFAFQPGVVDVFLDLEADFLHDVHFDFVAPRDAPGAAILRSVLRAGGAGACASAVDGVVFHRCPCLGLVIVRDVVLCWVSARCLLDGWLTEAEQDKMRPYDIGPAFDTAGIGTLIFRVHICSGAIGVTARAAGVVT